MDRNLDGIYFRAKRNGEWVNICFSDLTEEEREQVCEGRSAEWFRSLAYTLADTIKSIGEDFNLIGRR